jgi:lipopolysaccharide transport system permease protein
MSTTAASPPALVALARVLLTHRALTWEMTKRELTDRYVGQALGRVWALLHPLVMMGVYIFLFAFVFKAKVGGAKNLPLDYIVYMLSGLIPWQAFMDASNKGATVISANANLVKQVVFPIEILPVKSVLASLFTQVVSTALFQLGYLPWTYALLPLLWLCQILAMLGVSFGLAALGVFFKDIKDFVQVGTTIGMYTVPIVFLIDWVPERLRPLFWANPMTYMIWAYQDALYQGALTRPEAWLAFPLLAVLTLYLGFRVFRALRPQFGNVL